MPTMFNCASMWCICVYLIHIRIFHLSCFLVTFTRLVGYSTTVYLFHTYKSWGGNNWKSTTENACKLVQNFQSTQSQKTNYFWCWVTLYSYMYPEINRKIMNHVGILFKMIVFPNWNFHRHDFTSYFWKAWVFFSRFAVVIQLTTPCNNVMLQETSN